MRPHPGDPIISFWMVFWGHHYGEDVIGTFILDLMGSDLQGIYWPKINGYHLCCSITHSSVQLCNLIYHYYRTSYNIIEYHWTSLNIIDILQKATRFFTGIYTNCRIFRDLLPWKKRHTFHQGFDLGPWKMVVMDVGPHWSALNSGLMIDLPESQIELQVQCHSNGIPWKVFKGRII